MDRKAIEQHWPTSPRRLLSAVEIEHAREKIKHLLKVRRAVLVAHYYVDAEIQRLAEETGGVVSDSLEMAKFGARSSADVLVVAGVRFMGETAKILSPEKTVIMPTLKAECSLDLGCPPNEFREFCAAHPDRTVVVYVNTSAEVKALADWTVTSSVALEIVGDLHRKNQKILWAPDRYLGHWISRQTGADMLIWDAACVVHEEFKSASLLDLKKQYPEAGVLVHPESPAEVIALADVVGSTSALLKASHTLPHRSFIVATDRGIFYKMKQLSPEKTFIEAPTFGIAGGCKSCAHCPWMAMSDLANLESALEHLSNQILIPEPLRERAYIPLKRMIDFSAR